MKTNEVTTNTRLVINVLCKHILHLTVTSDLRQSLSLDPLTNKFLFCAV